MKIYNYLVEGEGAFPVEMLRQDTAWPAQEHDVQEIERSIVNPSNDGWMVRVHSIKAPASVRWQNVGCEVRDVISFVVEGMRDQEN